MFNIITFVASAVIAALVVLTLVKCIAAWESGITLREAIECDMVMYGLKSIDDIAYVNIEEDEV